MDGRTRQRVVGAILAGSLLVAWLVGRPALVQSGEEGSPERKETPGAPIRPLLAKYCLACHGDKKPRGGLNLASLPIDERPGTDPGKWKHVWDRVKARQMPPPDQPQPTEEERERLTSWIEGVFARHAPDGQPDPGPLRPRRLNVREYRNMLRDLAVFKGNALPRKVAYTAKPDGSVNLYHAIIPPPEHPCAFVSRTLPQDTHDGGFDTVGENLSIPPYMVEKYLRCSKLLLDDMFTLNAKLGESYQWPLYSAVRRAEKGPWPRGVTTTREATAAFLREFAARAFRRPVTAEEVEKYVKLYDLAREKGEDFDAAIRLPLQAVLVSPRFVVLWGDPAGEGPGKGAAVRPLDGHELATRLACFLWSSLPDRELTLAAEQGRLNDPEVIEQQVRRMLHDRRITDGLFEGFVCQWLQLDKLDRNAPDADLYPTYFQNNLGELMNHELLLFADAIMAEDRSILEFVDADWGFVCYPLAQHYGIENFPGKKPPGNAEPPWYRMKFTDKRRGGVLTMGKVLVGTSQPQRTSPVHRGKWVLETILGAPPPPPPPDVDNVLKEGKDEGMKSLTVRQRLERHRADAACFSCHRLIDPLGMALETFDPVGKWRDRDQDQPIDASGTLADGKEFKGVVELKALLLSRKDEFVRCFVERMLTYALGRKLELGDAAVVRQIAEAVARDDYRFSRAVVEVARSYPFRHRRTRETAD
jgi:hypothetical protein